MSIELIIVAIVVTLIFVLNYLLTKKRQSPGDIHGDEASDDESSPSRLRRLTDRLNTKRIVTIIATLIAVGGVYFFWGSFADWFSKWFALSWLGTKSGLTSEIIRTYLWIPASILAVIVALKLYKKDSGEKTQFDPIGAFFGLIVLLFGSAIALALIAIPILILSILAKEFGVFDSIENIVRVKTGGVSCTTQDELDAISKKGGFRNAETLNICPSVGRLHFSDNKVLFRIPPDFAKKLALKGDEIETIEKFMKIRLIGGTTYYIEPLPLKSRAGYRSMYEWLAVTSVPLQVIPHWDGKSP